MKTTINCIEIVYGAGTEQFMLPFLDDGVTFSELVESYGTYPVLVHFQDKNWIIHTSDQLEDCWEEIEIMR